MVIVREHKRNREKCYEIIDIHGSPIAVPAWMTEAHWRSLGLICQPSVPREVLNSLSALLLSHKAAFNKEDGLLIEGGINDYCKATSTGASAEIAKQINQSRPSCGVGETLRGSSDTNTKKQ